MVVSMSRLEDLKIFYELFAERERTIDGKHKLEECDGHKNWPERGVYFFFESGEVRSQTGIGQRVVRVGTHALAKNSQTSLWKRLKQHKGNDSDCDGNHRGSIFRSHVGSALLQKDNWPKDVSQTWSIGSTASREIRLKEKALEQSVSQYIGKMPFIWLEVNDEPGPESLRGFIERNSIALLSNFESFKNPIDPPSATWPGHLAKSEKVRKSGLWNSNHVSEEYDPGFLEIFKRLIRLGKQ